jgi:hypothetical protein
MLVKRAASLRIVCYTSPQAVFHSERSKNETRRKLKDSIVGTVAHADYVSAICEQRKMRGQSSSNPIDRTG